MFNISLNDPNEPFIRRDASYLEVILESILAAFAVNLTAGEVEAKVAGGVRAVGAEHRADFAGGVSAGVPHDARPCRWRREKKSVNKTGS